MKINPDDPRWTAYVLGELDEADQVEMERLLASSGEARALVEELRIATTLLKDELAAEAPETLSAVQHSAIYRAARENSRRWFAFRPAVWATGLAAAGLIVMIVATTLWVEPRQEAYVPQLQKSDSSSNAVQDSDTLQALNTPPPSPQGADSSRVSQNALKAPASPPVDAFKDQEKEEGNVRDFAVAPAFEPVPQIAKAAEQVADQANGARVESSLRSAAALPPAITVESQETIEGTLRDLSGATLPGAEITVTAIDTGRVWTVVTDEFGRYAIRNLPPGTYRLEASLPGFRTYVRPRIVLQANATSVVDPTLQVGQVAETVEVQASAATAETRNNRPISGSTINEGKLGELSATDNLRDRAAAEPATAPPGRFDEFDRLRRPPLNTEAYDRITDNPFIEISQNPLATLSSDVDTASYANIRRFINQNQVPPKDAVRIEELINYFTYDYPRPTGEHPIAAQLEVASAPWNPQHRLVRIGIKAKEINWNRRPSSNLVFLIDVSGSMQPAEKLPLLKSSMKMLVDNLTENDRVSMVVYAGATGMVLPPTSGDRKDLILRALENLHAGGSTNGASGIRLAYNLAVSNYVRGGINRVILATDGDFNVGVTNQGDLVRLIEEKARSGVFLSVLGFGIGNLKDSTLEKLADSGNGNYAYIDTINEGRKVLVEEIGGTLVTIAKDVKLQVEFNPSQVNAYRLIGYENRILRDEDFNNDLKDAGDMGAGHTVTVLFEVVPKGVDISIPDVDPLKYQTPSAPVRSSSREMLTLKVRYKEPEASRSMLLDVPLVDAGRSFSAASSDFKFAASVAEFGMILRDSPYKGNASLRSVLEMAQETRGADRNGYRDEFIGLVRQLRNGGKIR